MIIRVCANPEALGAAAARQTAQLLRDAIAECGTARIVLSTGASQFATIDHLSREDVDWSRVEMFHLDEYSGLPENHRASFQKYLQERFVEMCIRDSPWATRSRTRKSHPAPCLWQFPANRANLPAQNGAESAVAFLCTLLFSSIHVLLLQHAAQCAQNFLIILKYRCEKRLQLVLHIAG